MPKIQASTGDSASASSGGCHHSQLTHESLHVLYMWSHLLPEIKSLSALKAESLGLSVNTSWSFPFWRLPDSLGDCVVHAFRRALAIINTETNSEKWTPKRYCFQSFGKDAAVVRSGCCNKIPQAEWLINNRNECLTILD